jgi:hypothetical protein
LLFENCIEENAKCDEKLDEQSSSVS